MAGEIDGAQCVGRGDDDGVIAGIEIVAVCDRLEAEHRSEQHLVASFPQSGSGGLIVRMRSRDENGHVAPCDPGMLRVGGDG